MNQYCPQCDPDDGMESSVQVAATTTTVLLGLAKEFSASSAQSSVTKENIMHLMMREKIVIWNMFIFKGKK
jgi:hypothetical protein